MFQKLRYWLYLVFEALKDETSQRLQIVDPLYDAVGLVQGDGGVGPHPEISLPGLWVPDEEFVDEVVEVDQPGVTQVWPLTQFFLFPFCENSLICLEGKSMTPHRGNTILFCSSQQLPRLHLGPLQGFLS